MEFETATMLLRIWENLEIYRTTLKNVGTGDLVTKNMTPEQLKDDANFHDDDTGVELEVVEKVSLLEWFANEYKRFGCVLEFVTDCSQEGSQFCRGFGGIGGILRYQVDTSQFEVNDDDLAVDWSDDDF